MLQFDDFFSILNLWIFDDFFFLFWIHKLLVILANYFPFWIYDLIGNFTFFFCRCSLLNWCVEREKPGTRAVLLAFCATKEWIRPTCAKEKARSIAKLAMARILDPKALDLVLVPAVFKWLKKISQSLLTKHESSFNLYPPECICDATPPNPIFNSECKIKNPQHYKIKE